MKNSKRFTDAVTKLYNAFHKNQLLSSNCSQCAVGNICDNNGSWSRAIRTEIDTLIIPHRIRNRRINYVHVPCIQKTGYSIDELARIEEIFVLESSCKEKESKETQFKGLCAVVEYLCELEGIPNVMDYTCLFETEADQPKYKLEEVFAE